MRACWFVAAALVAHPAALRAEERTMSFSDILNLALAHNLDIHLARSDAQITGDDIAIAHSAFESRLVGDAHVDIERQPASVTSLPSSTQRGVASFGFEGKRETGLNYSAAVGVQIERNASPFDAIYSPGYTTSLSFSLTQPLLRGAWSAALLPLEVADRRHTASKADIRVRLETLIGSVEVGYWNLVVAFKEREARQSSLKLAQDQLADSTRLVRLGTISDLDLVEAQAGVNRREQELVLVDQQVAVAEGDLLDVVQQPNWDATIVPTDSPDVPPVSTTIDQQMEIARKNRPDLRASQARIDAEVAELALAKDKQRPALDLYLKGGVFGFAGSFQDNYATQPLTDPSLMPSYNLDKSYNGGPIRSLINLATGDFIVTLGVQLQLPWKNTQADARHERQLHVLEKARLTQTALLARVRTELHRSLSLLEADANLIKVADEAVAVNQRLLTGMRKRFALGGTTSFDVLRVADEVTRAEIAAARARASYRVSLARLATANGTLLQAHSVSEASIGN